MSTNTKTRTYGHLPLPVYHRPFLRYIDPPADGAAPPADPTPPPAAPVPTPPPAPAAPPAPAPAPPATPPPVNYHGTPDEYVRELRNENKTAREAREAAEKLAGEREQELTTTAAERDALRRENVLLLNAPRLGARADLLLDSSSFTRDFANVDLADPAAVDKAITDAIEKNSTFKAGPALPAMSGGGPQGGQLPSTPITLDGAVKKALGG